MKFLPNNFIIKQRNNNCLLPAIIFYKTKATKPAAITTAAIAIFMQVVVSVNTAETGSHVVRPDAEITKAPATWAKTLNGISKNLLIAQQSPKMPTKQPWQPPYSSAEIALKASSTLNHLHVSQTTTATIPADAQKTRKQARGSTAEISASYLAKGDCKSHTAAWGDIDPNIFFICDKQTKQPLQLHCPEGTGFFLGLGFSGCTPFEQWPACISSRHQHGEQVPLCDAEHMQQLWVYKDPNKFYACLKDTIKPTILNCETGKGFVHVAFTTSVVGGGVDGAGGGGGVGVRAASNTLAGIGVGATTASEIVGCANWEKWRNYMYCNDYY